MKTGIIVYSHTGNTYEVAETLQKTMGDQGRDAVIEKITVESGYDPEKSYTGFTLDNRPDPSCYDSVVFAAPVMAFSLCPVMKSYLKALDSIAGISTALLVTQHFPYRWLGGNRGIRQMRQICSSKGGDVKSTGIINWSRKDRDKQITMTSHKILLELQ